MSSEVGVSSCKLSLPRIPLLRCLLNSSASQFLICKIDWPHYLPHAFLWVMNEMVFIHSVEQCVALSKQTGNLTILLANAWALCGMESQVVQPHNLGNVYYYFHLTSGKDGILHRGSNFSKIEKLRIIEFLPFVSQLVKSLRADNYF